VWIGADRSTVEQAVRRKVFGRGFRAEVAVPPDLAAAVEDQIAAGVREALALANKAGLVVTGFARVEAALGAGGVAALLHARDAAADGVRKLDAAARRSGVTVISPLDGAALDLALGRANVVHAALLAGPLSEVVVARADDLGRYRNDNRAAAGPDEDDTGQPAGTDTE
jgi:hypothetical protein